MGYFKMTRVALKWAVSKPVTSRYPFEPRVAILARAACSSLRKRPAFIATFAPKNAPPALSSFTAPKSVGPSTACCASIAAIASKPVRKSR